MPLRDTHSNENPCKRSGRGSRMALVKRGSRVRIPSPAPGGPRCSSAPRQQSGVCDARSWPKTTTKSRPNGRKMRPNAGSASRWTFLTRAVLWPTELPRRSHSIGRATRVGSDPERTCGAHFELQDLAAGDGRLDVERGGSQVASALAPNSALPTYERWLPKPKLAVRDPSSVFTVAPAWPSVIPGFVGASRGVPWPELRCAPFPFCSLPAGAHDEIWDLVAAVPSGGGR